MSPNVKPIPDGYPIVTPYLTVRDGAKAIEFYSRVFGAKERVRMGAPGGKVGHAELDIGSSLLMLADEMPEMGTRAPPTIGGSPVTIAVYVENVDATVARAVALGARVVKPVATQFYGDRAGLIEDPFGHAWHVATHVEDVSGEEMARRAAAAMP